MWGWWWVIQSAAACSRTCEGKPCRQTCSEGIHGQSSDSTLGRDRSLLNHHRCRCCSTCPPRTGRGSCTRRASGGASKVGGSGNRGDDTASPCSNHHRSCTRCSHGRSSSSGRRRRQKGSRCWSGTQQGSCPVGHNCCHRCRSSCIDCCCRSCRYFRHRCSSTIQNCPRSTFHRCSRWQDC